MEILSKKSFKTRNLVKVTCRVGDDGEAYLRFEGLNSVENSTARYGRDHPVFFHPEEREAMQTLLAGGKLEVKPKFYKGDIVRFKEPNSDFAGRGYSAQEDALAVVTSDYDGSEKHVEVKWICTRSGSQFDGGYEPECFQKIEASDLTEEDYVLIGQRALRTLDKHT